MDQQLIALFELSEAPAFAVKEGLICYRNAAAQSAFPELRTGTSVGSLIPDRLSGAEGDVLSGSVSIHRDTYRVRGVRVGELTFYTLAPDTASGRGPVSDGLLAKVFTELNIERLCMERLSDVLRDDQEAESYLDRMRGCSYRLLRQVSNLNLAVQLREHSVATFMSQVELVSFCGTLVNSVSRMRAPERAKLSFSTGLTELKCVADERLLTRLLLNLLSNALERCGGDREIRVELSQTPGAAVISVSDNGPGISPEVLRNVFTRYQLAVDPEHLDRAASAGLGLSLAEGIARLHDGVLMLESREGRGTHVSVQLPLAHSRPFSAPRDIPPQELEDLYLTELSEVIDPLFYAADPME